MDQIRCGSIDVAFVRLDRALHLAAVQQTIETFSGNQRPPGGELVKEV